MYRRMKVFPNSQECVDSSYFIYYYIFNKNKYKIQTKDGEEQ